ncbi:MAG: type IV toxin-antitoxin system AbiEi family antitoxin domain-containing protein [Nocardioidaceae bacterium]|nr:MAG: type IV toxin-antitoxin system AbiEi family antitoxin domain-containing protein [Nocardioidaceae bacterium]
MATAQQRLWEIALDQHGFVTTDDARALDVAPHALKLLAQRGTLRREAHGVYRFERFPSSPADDYRQAVLWTGRPEAALSHETALDLLELAEVNPDRIHLTVPVGSRVRRQGGEHIVVHAETLTPDQISWWQGIRCVTAATAIRQVIAAGATQVHLIRQAIDTARDNGAITAAEQDELMNQLEARLAR